MTGKDEQMMNFEAIRRKGEERNVSRKSGAMATQGPASPKFSFAVTHEANFQKMWERKQIVLLAFQSTWKELLVNI